MVRVAHQKSAKQANLSNGVRSSKVAKQRKNHKVVIESDSQDKENSRAVLSFHAEPPPGYTFIPAGNPQLTAALKEFAKKGNHQILAVTTTPHASRHELSREVHRIGFHFPTEVVSQVCNHYGIRLTSGGKLVEEKDDDKLFMRLYQKGQLVLDEKVRDQVTINTEAKQIIQDLFPNIPDNDLFQIIKTAFQLGDGKVGTADEIPLVRRAQLSVVAHIRHTYTSYDKLLRSVPYSEARHRVENITLQKLVDWRGDGKDDKQAMDDTLREVVVISDEEDSEEVEEGQLLENEHLRVQPVNSTVHLRDVTGGRPRSPIEINSDEDAPRGYRYLPQVVRRIPLQDSQALQVARQQSRYAVWDRLRQEHRGGAISQPTRVIERVLLDEPTINSPRPSYISREPQYIAEPVVRRVLEPLTRVVAQPTPPTLVRGADGKLYERIDSYSEQVPTAMPSRRVYTPPLNDYNRQYVASRPVSPPPQPPRLHRRTESYDNDGTILPSIEAPNSAYESPGSRRNPFDDTRTTFAQRNAGAYESNQQQSVVIDLTSRAEQASKRRRVEEPLPSPYLSRHDEREYTDYQRNGARQETSYQHVDKTHTSQQNPIPLEMPVPDYSVQRDYNRAESRTQPQVIYREEVTAHGVPSPRSANSRYPPHNPYDAYQTQSPRRIESSQTYDRQPAPIPATNGVNDRGSRTVLEEVPQSQAPSYYAEPTSRYLRPEVRNPFAGQMQSSYYVQDLPAESSRREYIPSVVPEYHAVRDSRPRHAQYDNGTYQQSNMPPPPTIHRDGHSYRTSYVQN